MAKLIDLTHTIVNGLPVYPGDDETKLFQTKFIAKDSYNSHRLEISVHAGTHIDSPMHFLDNRPYISQLPLEAFIGQGCLIDVRGEKELSLKEEYLSQVKMNSIVLFYSGMDQVFGQEEYFNYHPIMTLELARFLIEKEVKIVGMDFISPDWHPFLIHKEFFQHHVLIMENLTNLGPLKELESFEVMAFPLKIDADSSVLRVIARELTT